MRLDPDITALIAADQDLWRDFNDICDRGGRLAGSESEKRAFALLRETRVRLQVYDVRGQVVATLVDEVRSAGRHEVVWDARGAASGVYFYRIETPEFDATRKMILLK